MFFDIGANIGEWAKSNIGSTDKIVCVEASPETYNKLCLNCANMPSIYPINIAVCDNQGNDIIFYHANADTISTMNKDWLTSPSSRFYNHGYKEIVCKTTTIDNLILSFGKPELIKIDVEGGEFECVKSLSVKVDLLCFEWASEMNDITFNCLDHLKNIGFDKFYVQKLDNYTFRPTEDQYIDINETKNILSNMIPKVDWGMVWCR